MWIQLAIMGLLVALFPLIMVWVSSDTNKYRKLTWVTLFITFDLILFGAFTRLTDSGLGCPDWPGCYGQANPFQAHADIKAAQILMPSGPVTMMKPWIEMIHRYMAMGVGVLIATMMCIAWYRWLKSKRKNIAFKPWFPTLLFVFVCVQGAFGAWTVTMKLQPIIVTIHLILGMSLLGLLTWVAVDQTNLISSQNVVSSRQNSLRSATLWVTVVVALQIALGGWVSTNYAALACTDFPLCHGQVIPKMDFGNGFSIWRSLGKTANGDYLTFDALTAIHWVHRNFAFIVIGLVVWLGHKAIQTENTKKIGRFILMAIAFQFLTGISTIYFKWPLTIAVMHNGGAAILVMLLVVLNYKNHIQGVRQPQK